MPHDWLSFSDDGRVDVTWNGRETSNVRWRVRGARLEMDKENDGGFKMRLRAHSRHFAFIRGSKVHRGRDSRSRHRTPAE